MADQKNSFPYTDIKNELMPLCFNLKLSYSAGFTTITIVKCYSAWHVNIHAERIIERMNNFNCVELSKDFKMPFNKIIKRELEVAFSKHSQPLWFRVSKYVLLAGVLFLFWGSPVLWI